MIDLRSDWVQAPTERMWAEMRIATPEALPRLEAAAAELLGKEAAVWTPTCTAANLAALLALTRPGDRVALQPDAHILTTEGMGITHLARLEPVDLESADRAALVCVENTHTRAGGTVMTEAETARLAALARCLHLDGARLPNAAAALGVPLAALAAAAETVALSLNKGLGAPLGAVLAGPAARIEEARVQLRRIGAASLHQAHIAAAAGLVALERVPLVAADNARARALAAQLRLIGGASVSEPETNIVLCTFEPLDTARIVESLGDADVLALAFDGHVRFVLHNEIDDDAVGRAAAAVAQVVAA